jgi:hypothetical protein
LVILWALGIGHSTFAQCPEPRQQPCPPGSYCPRPQYFAPPPGYQHYGPGRGPQPIQQRPEQSLLESLDHIEKRLNQLEKALDDGQRLPPTKSERGPAGPQGIQGPMGLQGPPGPPGKDAATTEVQALFTELKGEITKQAAEIAKLQKTLNTLQGKIRVKIEPQNK